MSRFHRLRQVVEYGWKHAGQISEDYLSGKKRFAVFFDILKCYNRFGMWSNQYMQERFWEQNNEQRSLVGERYCEASRKREAWVKDFYENRAFFIKYGNIRFEKEHLRAKRNSAYAKRYHAGDNLLVEYNVNLSRQHHLDGHITIGDNVLLAKNVFIDYSGDVTIKDNVQLANEVIIETHHHAFHSDPNASRSVIIPTSLVIEEGAVIGSRAVILSSCHYIGKNSRVGAGAVVTHNVPDYAVVVGIPAQIKKYLNEAHT